MRLREIIVICLILCCILSFQTVLAADVDSYNAYNNTLASGDADEVSSSNDLATVSLSEEGDILGDPAGSFAELQTAISGTDSGATLVLEKNYTYNAGTDSGYTNGITINKPITIKGIGNIVIDAQAKARIFSITGAAVTLQGITFTNAKTTGDGGAINSNYDLTIENCNFTYNVASQGGAIYSSGGNVLIKHSNFNNSQSTTVATNNNGGGAIYKANNNKNLIIDYSSFNNNFAQKYGGAILATGDNVVINNTVMFNNSAKTKNAHGGALCVVGGNSNLSVLNSKFDLNDAHNGGAINVNGINGNSKGIYVDGCNFTNNKAREQSGGAIRLEQSIKNAFIYNSLFINCTSIREGGAISQNIDCDYLKFENLTMINCTQTGSTSCGGGGIDFVNVRQSLSLVNLNFTNCSANDYGGGLLYHGTRVPTSTIYENLYFENCSSNREGGSFAIVGLNAANHITFANAKIVNSYSKRNGGAIFWANDYGTINNITIIKSKAAGEGGAICVANAHAVISNVNVTDASAGNGGAISLANNNQEIINCTFENCDATYGGAVYVGEYLYIYIQNSTFNASNAYNGGAVYYAGSVGALMWIENSTFTNNNASHNGGAIYYIIDKDDSTKKVSRDYNNFDGTGIVDGDRTTVNMIGTDGSSYAKRIFHSYFKNNNDYKLNVTAMPDQSTIMGIVNISNPNDPNRNSYEIVLNVTKDDQLVTQLILNTPENFTAYFNNVFNKFIIGIRNNLEKDTFYNVTVGFEDSEYLYKEARVNFTTINRIDKGDFHILQDLIDAAVSNAQSEGVPAVLNLQRSFEFMSMEDYEALYGTEWIADDYCMNITSPITINGNGYSISALGYSRIFNITGNNVVLNNINFIYGNATGKYKDNENKGGAIFWAGENGIIKASTVGYNYAEYGAGIYFNSTALNAKIANSTFIKNNATKNGGAIDCNAPEMNLTNTTFESNYADTGAALCREITATGGFGDNNTFISNVAGRYGAALAWIKSESININHYKFIDNTAGVSGGAIYVGQNSIKCVVNNSYFKGNNITDFTDGHGGAIEWYASNGLVLNSTFIDNNAYNGGAIYVGSESREINITDSNFTANNAYGYGGAVNVAGSSVTLNNTKFFNNTASINGGALYVGGIGSTNRIYFSKFEGNNATNGYGGAIDWLASAGHIANTNFTRNTAEYGGAIYLNGISSNTNITNVIFRYNNATYNGGAIDCNSTRMNLTYTLFEYNYAGEYGAALCREVNATSGSGHHNAFNYNHAGIGGAALAWMNVKNININYYNFTGNTAGNRGAAIYATEGSDNFTVNNCNFNGNNITNTTEGSRGGAIDIASDNNTIKNSNFTNNNAYYGGAVFVGSGSGNTNITNVNFTRNNAFIDGGAVNLQASGVRINSTKFSQNTAANRGGALYVGGSGTTNVIYISSFDKNRAGENGGAIYWRAYAGHIDGTNFTSNAAQNGGALYLNGVSSNTNITHVIFKSNNATNGNGGAIDCNATKMNLTYTLFESNYASAYGAALCRETGATSGSGHHNNFTSNRADIAGAALAWLNVKNINIDYYIFTDNTAGVSGGAIYASLGSDNFTVNHCDFKGNNVTNLTSGRGGAIDIESDDSAIKNSNFTNNNAYEGGAIYVGSTISGHTNITYSSFTRNNAYEDGGAINLNSSGVTLNHTNFTFNTAALNGGAVYVGGQGTSNVIYYSRFADNQAGSHGGAIDWRASAGEIMESNFVRNTADYGGAIYLNGVSSGSKISHDYFADNTARFNGGAIDCNATLMNLTHTLFVSNYAQYGAALCREANAAGGFGGNNTFKENHAYISGAALAWLSVDNIKINNYTFINNTADFSGGAIYVDEESENCQVYNCTFEDDFVTSAIRGRGGAIDWLGNNGTVMNTTFTQCIAYSGGAIYVGDLSDNMTVRNVTFTLCKSLSDGGSILIYGDNATIRNSSFISSLAIDDGGAIAGFGSDNANITECFFKYNIVGGHIEPSGEVFGQGGAIHWENSRNLRISNSQFESDAAFLSGGSISADNCSDSILYNIRTNNDTSSLNGGSVSWINSDNVTVDSSMFNDSGTNYKGGTFFLDNINATIKNTKINSTWASWDEGGAIYVDGNLTVDNVTFNDTHSDDDIGTAIYFSSGISKVVNSTFTNSLNSIYVSKDANVTLEENTLTSDDPTKGTMYLEDNTYEGSRNVAYTVWNDGNLWLKDNNFDNVIYNNGTIWTKTTIKMLNNESHNVTWNEYFTFFANITDDNLNTIISVRSLNTTNNVTQQNDKHYALKYNKAYLQCIYQGVFKLIPYDPGLKNPNNEIYNGTLRVKMPVSIELTEVEVTGGNIVVTAKITPDARSNFTIKGEDIHFSLDDGTSIDCKILNITEIPQSGFITWDIAYANLTKNNLAARGYSLTATYGGDDVHLGSESTKFFTVHHHESWINVVIANIDYGQKAIALITTNSNGTVTFHFHGKEDELEVTMTKNETTGNYEGSVEIDYTEYKTSGMHDADVVLDENDYYSYATNQTSFEVRKLNTTVGTTLKADTITVGDKQVITVTVSDTSTFTPSGFVDITIGGETYYKKLDAEGKAVISIYDLAKGPYNNYVVNYEGDGIFNGNTSTVSFSVDADDDYNITVKVDDVKLGENATIYIVLPISVSQNLTVYVNNTVYNNVTVKDGLAIVNVNTTVLNNPGKYVVNVTYPGDDVYALKHKNGEEFTVRATDDWILYLEVEEHTYGQNTIFTVRLPSDVAVKKLNLTIDGENHTVTINDEGIGTLTLNNLTGGFHTVVANYTGDSRYVTKTNSTSFMIEQAPSTITLSQQGVNVIATVTDGATGKVIIFVDGLKYEKDLTGNQAVFENVLTTGDHSVVAIYEGDKNYTSSTNSTTDHIDKKTSSVNVTATNVTYGNASEITVKVPVDQKGYVRVVVNGTDIDVVVEIKNGEAKFNATGLSVNRYKVNVTYLGDAIYDVSENSTYFNITKANLTASVIAQNVTVNENASFVISVQNEDFTQKVKITNATSTLVDGDLKSLIYVNRLPAGTYNVNVTFYGNSNYNNKTIPVTFKVSAVKPSLNVTIADAEYPAGTSATVKVSGKANGTVLITVDDKPFEGTVRNGEATVPITGLNAGLKVAEVKFTSTDSYNLNANATYKFFINKTKSSIKINVTPDDLYSGDDAVLNITVSCTGDVIVYVDGEEYTRVLENNRIIINKNDLSAGEHTIVVYYPGDVNYESSSESYPFTVDRHTSKVNVTAKNTPYGEAVEVTVRTPAAQEGYVTIKIHDESYSKKLEGGVAVFNIFNLSVDTYRIDVMYDGDENYEGNENFTTVEVTPADLNPVVVGVNITKSINSTFVVMVPADYNGMVNITVDGVKYSGPADTVIRMAKLTPGVKEATVEFYGDANYKDAELKVSFVVSEADGTMVVTEVIENSTVIITLPENATGNVTVILPDGSNTTVNVTNGTAVIKLENMTPGTQNITVIYSGDGNYTNVTIYSNVTIPKYDTDMNVTVVPGDTTVVTVEVPENATGTVIVTIDGKEYPGVIEDGIAVVPVENLTPGNKTVIVEYSGDGNYSSTYAIENFTIEAGKTTPDIIVVDQGNGTVVVVVGDNATGNVTVKVGEHTYNATVINGTAVVYVNNETPGSHEIEVIYSGDDTHSESNTEGEIISPKYDTEMNVTVSKAVEGEPVIITVEVPVGATGEVIVNVGGQNYTGTITSDGKAQVIVDGISDGNHTIAVEYAGDGNFSANYTVSKVFVEEGKTTPEIVVVNQGNGTVVVVVGDNATGNVTVKVGDNIYNATVINGTATVTLENETPGVHDIEVIYSGDGNHTASGTNATITISDIPASIKITAEDISVGDKAIIIVELPKDAVGDVTIEIDGANYTQTIENGIARFEIEGLKAGNKTVTAVFEGDGAYARNFNTAQFTVSKLDSHLIVEITDANVGENITVTVRVPGDATGQVLIDIDGVGYYLNVSGGKGSAEIPRLSEGNYNVTLTYTGDEKYLSSTNKSTFEVSKLESFVIPMAHNIVVGENENIRLLVPSDATGNVTVVIDSEVFNFNLNDGLLTAVYREGEKYTVAISGGNGELVISGLPQGEYYVSVKYNGDDKYLPSTNTTIFTVAKDKTPMDVIDQGNGTIVVKLPSDATGNVTVREGDNYYTAEVINGTAVVTLDKTLPGEHDVRVLYEGDSTYSSNSTVVTVDVPKYDTPISVEVEDINVGDVEIVTVTLPEGATGTVTIEINAKEHTASVENGKAIFEVPDLAFGNKTVAVKYSGDNLYNDNYTTGQFTVSKVPSTVKATPKDITVGKDEVITVTVPSDATGKVLVTIDGVGYYADIINGKAKIIIPELAAGKYSTTVTYEGDDKYLESSTPIKFTVNKIKATVSVDADDIEQGEDAIVVVHVPSDATGTVTIVVNGKTYTTSVENGVAVFSVPGLTKGDYEITASYSGDDKYEANDNITDIEVHFKETPDDNGGNKVSHDAGVDLSRYATGNPIMVLLLILLSIGSTQIRRFKK